MKAFRVITVTKGKAHLSIMVGNSKEEIRNNLYDYEEEIEIKDVTDELRIDVTEVIEALRYYEVNELTQLLVIAVIETYDNLIQRNKNCPNNET